MAFMVVLFLLVPRYLDLEPDWFVKIYVYMGMAYIVFALVTSIYFFDVLPSTNGFFQGPVEPFVSRLEVKLRENGLGGLTRRTERPTPFYRYRWTAVYDLECGLTMHISGKKEGHGALIGPVERDNRDRIRTVLGLIKEANDEAKTDGPSAPEEMSGT